MSTSVSKSFTLHVAVPPSVPVDFYWTMDETGNDPRVDKVSGHALNASFNNLMDWKADPGLYNNCLSTIRTPGHSGEEASCDLTTGDLWMPNPGTGFSICFWIKILSSVGIPVYTVSCVLYDSFGHPITRYELQFNPTGDNFTFFYIVGGVSRHWVLDGLLSFPFDVWNFVHLFYDGDKVGISVNNIELTDGSGLTDHSEMVFNLLIRNRSLPGTNGYLLLDELAINLQSKFTAPQLTYLYNGGAGRTWPITLP